MRHSFSSFFRLIATFLVMTVLTSGIAMAAYVCPQLTNLSVPEKMVKGMACADMDKEKPVHCAQYQSGAQLALEYPAAAASFAPITVSFVVPAPWPIAPVILVPFRADVPLGPGADRPYIRTQRLRI